MQISFRKTLTEKSFTLSVEHPDTIGNVKTRSKIRKGLLLVISADKLLGEAVLCLTTASHLYRGLRLHGGLEEECATVSLNTPRSVKMAKLAPSQ